MSCHERSDNEKTMGHNYDSFDGEKESSISEVVNMVISQAFEIVG